MSSSKKPTESRQRPVTAAKSGRYVVPTADGWSVRGSGGGRAASVHRTQSEAVIAAKEAIGAKGGKLVVHSTNGRIVTRHTIGRDPFQKISAVEGIAPTRAAKARSKQFVHGKLTSEERLKAIIEVYRPIKG